MEKRMAREDESDTRSADLKKIIRAVEEQRDRLEEFIELLEQAAEPPPKAGHPMQSIILDDHGTPRFHGNALVRYLLDAGPYDLNHLAMLPGIDRQDHEQLAQLIGYSTSGFGDLSYTNSAAVAQADKRADELLERAK